MQRSLAILNTGAPKSNDYCFKINKLQAVKISKCYKCTKIQYI